MARKPASSVPTPLPPLPATGGAYELVDGQLHPASTPKVASDTAPETQPETGV